MTIAGEMNYQVCQKLSEIDLQWNFPIFILSIASTEKIPFRLFEYHALCVSRTEKPAEKPKSYKTERKNTPKEDFFGVFFRYEIQKPVTHEGRERW